MMTFDTGTWGAATDASEEAQAQRRQEREEREAELRRIAEENRAARAREASARARQAARDEAEIAARAEADARAAAQAQAARQASEKENIAKAAKGQTEMDKIEAALAQVRKEKQARSNAMQRAARCELLSRVNATPCGVSFADCERATRRCAPAQQVRGRGAGRTEPRTRTPVLWWPTSSYVARLWSSSARTKGMSPPPPSPCHSFGGGTCCR